MSEGEQLLEIAGRAARMAGELLAERAAGGAERSIASKSTPTDLVSEADLAAERAIRELLRGERPDDGFLGEEGGGASGTSGLTWVVDPLDGTVNFLFGIPQWAVSVAVRDAQGMVAGAVYDPNRDELFAALRDGAASLSSPAHSEPGEFPLRGRAAEPRGAGEVAAGLAGAMVATGLAYDSTVRARQAAVLAELAPRVRDIRRFGSAALDLVWCAAGRCDAYYERGVKEWDVAAGLLICERAGLETRELPAREGLPWGVLVARPELAPALDAIVA
ncbi:MAG: inositol monophosphatase family protein [Solirubrobacteraceae bacterium]